MSEVRTGVGRLRPETSLVVLIDPQTRLAPALDQAAARLAAMARLLRGAALLGVPALATAHCPERLGPLVPELAALLEPARTLDKRAFSALGDPGSGPTIAAAAAAGRTVILAGAEAHVCVGQTALDLLAAGAPVALATDAVASRREADRSAALARLTQAGAAPLTVEAALFEWLGSADDPRLRAVLDLVR